MYEIRETKTRGKAMIATKQLNPGPMGLSIFVEDALFSVPPRGSKEDLSGPVPKVLDKFDPQIWTDWWMFRQQSSDTKRRILNLYTEMDCRHAVWLRNYLAGKKQEQQQGEEKYDEDDESILNHSEEFVRFVMVIRFNSVELVPPCEDGSGPGTDCGHGLFEMAGKMNHSCKPNCVWQTRKGGKSKEIRAISPIAKGEEMTLDYFGCELDPIHQRRDIIMSSKGFLCECTRCANEMGDDTRRFPCIHHETSGCIGVHLVDQPDASCKAKLLDCTSCGASASVGYLDKVLQAESDFVREISDIDRISEESYSSDLIDRIESLKPPHELHSLAAKCYEMKGLHYSRQGDYNHAAEAYGKEIACRNAILGDNGNNQITAFCRERLGDVLRHVDLGEAADAYRITARTLQVTRGASDPYSNCAIGKLLDVQKVKKSKRDCPTPDEERARISKLGKEVCGFILDGISCQNPSDTHVY